MGHKLRKCLTSKDRKTGNIKVYNSIGQMCKDELYIDGPQAQKMFNIEGQKMET